MKPVYISMLSFEFDIKVLQYGYCLFTPDIPHIRAVSEPDIPRTF